MRTKRRDDRLVGGEGICRPRHGDMLRMSEVRFLDSESEAQPSVLTSESEASAERSDPRETPRKPKPPWGVLCFTSSLSALGSAAPQAERLAVNRSSLPPWDRRPRPVRRGFHPDHLAVAPSGRIRCRTLIGFHPDPPLVSLWRPHRVAPLRETYIGTLRAPMQARSLVRFRELHLLFAETVFRSQNASLSEF
jgi:hypothetical protein